MTFRQKARAYAKGETVEHPPESIRLFLLAESMRWNHLPVAGGIYDQHPELLAQWMIIWEEKAKVDKAKAEQEKREMGSKKPKGR